MKKHIARELKRSAEELAKTFSKPSRDYYSGQTFTLKECRPLSDHCAAVIYKLSGGKLVLALAFYKRTKKIEDPKNPKKKIDLWKWKIFFLSDSHILGLTSIAEIKEEIELYNFQFNFKEADPF